MKKVLLLSLVLTTFTAPTLYGNQDLTPSAIEEDDLDALDDLDTNEADQASAEKTEDNKPTVEAQQVSPPKQTNPSAIEEDDLGGLDNLDPKEADKPTATTPAVKESLNPSWIAEFKAPSSFSITILSNNNPLFSGTLTVTNKTTLSNGVGTNRNMPFTRFVNLERTIAVAMRGKPATSPPECSFRLTINRIEKTLYLQGLNNLGKWEKIIVVKDLPLNITDSFSIEGGSTVKEIEQGIQIPSYDTSVSNITQLVNNYVQQSKELNAWAICEQANITQSLNTFAVMSLNNKVHILRRIYPNAQAPELESSNTKYQPALDIIWKDKSVVRAIAGSAGDILTDPYFAQNPLNHRVQEILKNPELQTNQQRTRVIGSDGSYQLYQMGNLIGWFIKINNRLLIVKDMKVAPSLLGIATQVSSMPPYDPSYQAKLYVHYSEINRSQVVANNSIFMPQFTQTIDAAFYGFGPDFEKLKGTGSYATLWYTNIAKAEKQEAEMQQQQAAAAARERKKKKYYSGIDGLFRKIFTPNKY